AYHSVFLDEPNQQVIGNFSLLPLRTRTRGPAMQLPALSGDVTELTIDASHESYDPLDETLALFRANTFFRNFEIKGPADRVLIYGILFVSEVIQKIKPQMSRRDAEKAVMNLALDTNFAIPGDATFPLNQAFEPPRDRQEAEVLRQYISQMRQELATRLLNRIYADGDAPSKWWLSFTKRKFMGKALARQSSTASGLYEIVKLHVPDTPTLCEHCLP
ncbi:ARP2/3 complex subunit Arc18, partial [Aureobasidium melanogenum]